MLTNIRNRLSGTFELKEIIEILLKNLPTIDIETGIQQTIHWINNNFSEIQKQSFEYIHKE